MELNEYQEKAMTTCTESCANPMYMLLNLAGELGEVASKIAKAIRKEQLVVENNNLVWLGCEEGAEDFWRGIKDELGDCLWQLSGTCTSINYTLEEVAERNLEKLADRKKRNVIIGNGDNR